jgi:hypothetical protein
MSKKIEDMQPAAAAIARLMIIKMSKDDMLKKMGVTGIYVSETLRPLAVQMAYYSRSRMSVADVKKMYAAAGLYHIGDAEAARANTWTLSSKHISGLAIDVFPEIDGNVAWNPPKEIRDCMGEIGKSCGMVWGGDWPENDFGHYQYKE